MGAATPRSRISIAFASLERDEPQKGKTRSTTQSFVCSLNKDVGPEESGVHSVPVSVHTWSTATSCHRKEGVPFSNLDKVTYDFSSSGEQ